MKVQSLLLDMIVAAGVAVRKHCLCGDSNKVDGWNDITFHSTVFEISRSSFPSIANTPVP